MTEPFFQYDFCDLDEEATSYILHVSFRRYNWVSLSFLYLDEIVDKHVHDGLIDNELREKISFILLRKHRHQTKKSIHRSLADIGKPSPSSKDFNLYFSMNCVTIFLVWEDPCVEVKINGTLGNTKNYGTSALVY